MRPELEQEVKEEGDLAALERAWATPPGVLGFLRSVRHTEIARRYLVTAFCFFALGGTLAFLMRIQLWKAENKFIGPDRYNQLFTMHGSTMMFLFAVPVMEAMGVYLVPLMVGTRNIALPRLNAFSYWIYLFGGIALYAFFFLNIGPDAGWFAYVPLSGPEYSPGKRIDIWSQLINFTEISALAVSVEIIITAFLLRAPGMTLNRIPLFVWSMIVTSFMIIFAMPSVMTGSLFLTTDRLVGTHFYNPAEGGDPLLYQHLFWFFGHPEVYIIFIPALGMISSILQAFCRRPVLGYTALVLSVITTAFFAFGLWVHHMFATNLPQLGMGFFTAASITIAIPTGVQIFLWIATIWLGRPEWKVPFLFVFGFFLLFAMGGITGIMLASVPLDLQLHDTFFVVAHFHYVLIGGAVFPLFGAFYFWFPKMTGRMMSERLGRWNFWLMFAGFNIAFFPMHILGLRGMTRRIYTYQPELHWDSLNQLATLGSGILAIGILLFVINVVRSVKFGDVAPANPWNSDTLEWSTASPPPAYNFTRIPVVSGRSPLWDAFAGRPVVRGLWHRQVLLTTPVRAEPFQIHQCPSPSIWPMLLALSVTGGFVGSVFTPWAVVWAAFPITICCIGWGWPTADDEEIGAFLERGKDDRR